MCTMVVVIDGYRLGLAGLPGAQLVIGTTGQKFGRTAQGRDVLAARTEMRMDSLQGDEISNSGADQLNP
jgi:hypothetical protein